jgi:hypothetical protein
MIELTHALGVSNSITNLSDHLKEVQERGHDFSTDFYVLDYETRFNINFHCMQLTILEKLGKVSRGTGEHLQKAFDTLVESYISLESGTAEYTLYFNAIKIALRCLKRIEKLELKTLNNDDMIEWFIVAINWCLLNNQVDKVIIKKNKKYVIETNYLLSDTHIIESVYDCNK